MTLYDGVRTYMFAQILFRENAEEAKETIYEILKPYEEKYGEQCFFAFLTWNEPFGAIENMLLFMSKILRGAAYKCFYINDKKITNLPLCWGIDYTGRELDIFLDVTGTPAHHILMELKNKMAMAVGKKHKIGIKKVKIESMWWVNTKTNDYIDFLNWEKEVDEKVIRTGFIDRYFREAKK